MQPGATRVEVLPWYMSIIMQRNPTHVMPSIILPICFELAFLFPFIPPLPRKKVRYSR